MGGSLAQIAAYGLLSWLSRVFGVLGGYMFATGVLTVYVAATGFRAGRPAATAIVAVSGLASIGWMAIANFLIDSDFKWLLFAFTLPWRSHWCFLGRGSASMVALMPGRCSYDLG